MTIEYKDSKRIQGLEYTASNITTSGFAQTWGKDPSNSQFEVSSGRINFLDNTSSTGDRTWLDLQGIIGSAVSTTKWVLRFKFNFSTLTSGSYYYEFDAGLSDTTVNNMTNQNFIGVRVLPSTIGNLWRPRTTDGTSYPRGGASASIAQTFSTGTDYYVEIKRTSASNWSISLSTTDAYDGDLQDDSYTDAGSATGLRYFKFGDAVTNTGTGFTMQGVCDVLEFYNDTNTAVATSSGDAKPTNVQDNSLFVEKDTAKRYWFSEAPVVTDDLTTDKGWASNTSDWTYNASGDYIDFATIRRSTTAQQIYIDVQDSDYLGSGNNLSDSAWTANFKVKTGTSASGNAMVYFGFSNNLADSGTTQQSATMKMNMSSSEGSLSLSVSRANFETSSSPARENADIYSSGNIPYSTDFYMTMTRSGDVFTLKAYSNSARTTQVGVTATVTVTGISSLRYIKAFNDSEQNQSYTSTGARLYDMEIINGADTWTRELPVTEGLKLHLDASQSSTITKDASNLVSQWNDFSSQGNNISQATSSKQPLFVANVQNGKPVIRFDGSNDMLQRTTYVNGALTQPNTVFYVGKIGGNEDFTFASGTLGSENSVLTTGSNLTMYAGSIYGADSAVTTLQQYTFLYNTTSSTMRVNGTQTDTGSVGTHTMQGFTVGANYTDAQWSAIDVCEILVYNGTLSDTNRDKIESYLMEKWGL
jgi:hypothetical protein